MTSGGKPGVNDALCGIVGYIEPFTENDRTFIFLIDDADRRRIKSRAGPSRSKMIPIYWRNFPMPIMRRLPRHGRSAPSSFVSSSGM